VKTFFATILLSVLSFAANAQGVTDTGNPPCGPFTTCQYYNTGSNFGDMIWSNYNPYPAAFTNPYTVIDNFPYPTGNPGVSQITISTQVACNRYGCRPGPSVGQPILVVANPVYVDTLTYDSTGCCYANSPADALYPSGTPLQYDGRGDVLDVYGNSIVENGYTGNGLPLSGTPVYACGNPPIIQNQDGTYTLQYQGCVSDANPNFGSGPATTPTVDANGALVAQLDAFGNQVVWVHTTVYYGRQPEDVWKMYTRNSDGTQTLGATLPSGVNYDLIWSGNQGSGGGFNVQTRLTYIAPPAPPPCSGGCDDHLRR
jgi:hypothetical protein